MAIDEADQADSGGFDEAEESEPDPGPGGASSAGVGEYIWADFMEEHGFGDEADTLYPNGTRHRQTDDLGLSADDEAEPFVPSGSDWDRVEFDPAEYLGFHPDDLERRITETAAANAKHYQKRFLEYVDPETTPVVKDVWTWEHFKWDYYYDDTGDRPRSGGEIVEFDPTDYLSFDPDEQSAETVISQASDIAKELDNIIEERTVDVNQDLDEDEFFSTADGNTTLVNRYDLEKAVPLRKKTHFQEEERYWVNKPYAFVIIFHSRKENEKKYYLVEPYLTEIEEDLKEFLTGKLRTAIKYADDEVATGGSEEDRKTVIERETKKLLRRYDLYEKSDTTGDTDRGFLQNILEMLNQDEEHDEEDDSAEQLQGIESRPEPIVLEEDPDRLSEYQIEKLLYLLKRDFIGYERIDGIKHDINVEDISCDGYNSPVFVYHTDYEQIISNVYHGKSELDEFVVKLAQRSGKGISKRRPQVDATLPDGSRAQLTLGREVSDHGTNYTIRQFKDVPFTPIDLVNWNTFSLEEMAFLWLCIENHKSLIFAGGTASGKTTSLNAVSLFIPSNTKIVSIEDTREVELPQRNWVASVTRPSFSDDDQGDVDEFDLLEAALRQRPDYIVMGEIRGEEGRTLFQVMSTGHTTYTTFHADSVGEVLKRFTTDPINVSKTMFTALDLVSIQTQTRVQGNKVRRNKKLTEVNHYDADTDEINVQDVYQWQAETDEFLKMGDSNTLAEIKFDRGWSQERLENEIFKREVILAYLIKNGINEYTKVAATIQAFINDPDTILTLIANGQLEESLEDLREMESVEIQVDPEKEELVPRPDPDEEGYNFAMDLLEQAEESLFEDYRGTQAASLESAIGGMAEADATFQTDSAETDDFEFGGEVDEEFQDEAFDFGDGDAFTVSDDGSVEETTAAADEDSGEDVSAGGLEGEEPADEPAGEENIEGDIEDLWEDTETPALESGDEREATDTEPEQPALEAGDADTDQATKQKDDSNQQTATPPELTEGSKSASDETLPESVESSASKPETAETDASPPTKKSSGGSPDPSGEPADQTPPPTSDQRSDSPFGSEGSEDGPFSDSSSDEDSPFGSSESDTEAPFGGSDSGAEGPFSGSGSTDESPFTDEADDGQSDDVEPVPPSDDSEPFGEDEQGQDAESSVFDQKTDADNEDGGGSFEDGEDPFGGDDDSNEISGFEDVSFEFDDGDDDDES